LVKGGIAGQKLQNKCTDCKLNVENYLGGEEGIGNWELGIWAFAAAEEWNQGLGIWNLAFADSEEGD